MGAHALAGGLATWLLAGTTAFAGGTAGTAAATGTVEMTGTAEAAEPERGSCLSGRGPAAVAACRSALHQAATPAYTRQVEAALAAHLLERGDAAGAVSVHRAAVAARPRDAAAWVRLGETLFHAAGQPEESEKALLEATRLAAAPSRAWVVLGLVRNALGRHEDALQAFAAAEAADPEALAHRPAARLAQAASREGRTWPGVMPLPPLP